MKIKYLGHACLQIETMGKTIIVDPFISQNPLAKDRIKIKELKADYLLITHGHADHVLDVELIAEQNKEVQLISNPEIGQWFSNKGLGGIQLNHGGAISLEFGELKMVYATHSSGLPDGSYGGNPAGFVLSNEEGTIYIAGDTALTKEMELIPLFAPNLDLAIFPIGNHFTMGYEDAVIASDFVQCDKVLGIHYDTFSLIEINTKEAVEHFKQKGKELILLEIEQSITL